MLKLLTLVYSRFKIMNHTVDRSTLLGKKVIVEYVSYIELSNSFKFSGGQLRLFVA